MPSVTPEQVVRRLFAAHTRGDRRQVLALLAEDVDATTLTGDARPRTQLSAQRLLLEGDDVIAVGRIRVFEDGTLSDSPAAWRLTVREGLVRRFVPCAAAAPASA